MCTSKSQRPKLECCWKLHTAQCNLKIKVNKWVMSAQHLCAESGWRVGFGLIFDPSSKCALYTFFMSTLLCWRLRSALEKLNQLISLKCGQFSTLYFWLTVFFFWLFFFVFSKTHFWNLSPFSLNCKHKAQFSNYIHKTQCSQTIKPAQQNSFICGHSL